MAPASLSRRRSIWNADSPRNRRREHGLQFWTITKNGITDKAAPGDELDVVECYGGVGKGNPNHPGYSVTSHFWKQKGPDGKALKPINTRVDMLNLGDKSYWSTTFHTYGLKVTATDTIYYLDNVEVLRQPHERCLQDRTRDVHDQLRDRRHQRLEDRPRSRG